MNGGAGFCKPANSDVIGEPSSLEHIAGFIIFINILLIYQQKVFYLQTNRDSNLIVIIFLKILFFVRVLRVLANGAPAMFPLSFQEFRPSWGGDNMRFHDHYVVHIAIIRNTIASGSPCMSEDLYDLKVSLGGAA